MVSWWEGNSSCSFAGRTVLEEKNATWETYFMVFKFVMQPCLCYAYYVNMVIEFVKIVLEGTGVEHGNTELSF